LGNGEQRRTPRQKGECNLARRCAMRSRNLGKHAASLRTRIREAAMAERAVPDDRDAVLLAPRHNGAFDASLLEMIEDLIAGDPAFPRDRQSLFEVVLVEIADAPRADEAAFRQFLEGRDRIGERMMSAPVQQVAVEPVRAQALQRLLA